MSSVHRGEEVSGVTKGLVNQYEDFGFYTEGCGTSLEGYDRLLTDHFVWYVESRL